jgi:hypothetical protein
MPVVALSMRCSHVLTLAVAMLFVCIVYALFSRCRVPFAHVVACHVRTSRVLARRHASLRAIALPAQYRVHVRVPFTRCLRVVDISFARSCHASGSCVARCQRVIIN